VETEESQPGTGELTSAAASTAPAPPGGTPVSPPAPAAQAPCRTTSSHLPGWPFLLYLTAWAALAAATIVLLTGPGAATVPVDDPSYPGLLLAGLTLAACGPVLSLVTWLVAWARAVPECRGGLLTIALVRGASATLFGVVAWWAALLLVDALRLGMVR
jgi:hypothetical protein